jgi:tRNA-uridine 2-sulfurtransferase
MAAGFSITRYPGPGGGCLLTEKAFAGRLRDLLAARPDPKRKDLEMLKLGRHFRLSPEVRLVVGRNKHENDELDRLATGEDTRLDAAGIPGPLAVLSGPAPSRNELETALSITLAYSDSQGLEKWPVTISRGDVETEVVTPVSDKKIFSGLLL